MLMHSANKKERRKKFEIGEWWSLMWICEHRISIYAYIDPYMNTWTLNSDHTSNRKLRPIVVIVRCYCHWLWLYYLHRHVHFVFFFLKNPFIPKNCCHILFFSVLRIELSKFIYLESYSLCTSAAAHNK